MRVPTRTRTPLIAFSPFRGELSHALASPTTGDDSQDSNVRQKLRQAVQCRFPTGNEPRSLPPPRDPRPTAGSVWIVSVVLPSCSANLTVTTDRGGSPAPQAWPLSTAAGIDDPFRPHDLAKNAGARINGSIGPAHLKARKHRRPAGQSRSQSSHIPLAPTTAPRASDRSRRRTPARAAHRRRE